ncbi:MAG: 2-C-methyl-D-erythritol 4-phosphate cytidylyltransferase [Chitinophagaceae bacterium]
MKKFAIVVAGGTGTRMGSILPKQFLLVHGKPVIWYCIHAFFEAFDDITVIVVLPQAHIDTGKLIIQSIPQAHRIIIAHGGHTRFQSVKNGLALVPYHSVVFIHDGVRCLVTSSLIKRCYETAVKKGNAIPAIAAVDSLRIETLTGNEMIDRKQVRIIQTPQTFLSDIIKEAFDQDYKESFTDDASVVESRGQLVYLVEGEITNFKITTQTDLLIAEQIMKKRKELPGQL